MSKEDSSDRKTFREAVKGVKRLKQNLAAPYREKKRPIPEQRLKDDREVISSLLSDEVHAQDVETGEELLFQRPGVQNSVMRKLRRGQYAVEDELDLHRCTSEEARERLAQFLTASRNIDKRCVRVIHGKGLGSVGGIPVLKNKVNSWLRQREDVLAFSSCLPQHGGTGAVYILLKRAP